MSVVLSKSTDAPASPIPVNLEVTLPRGIPDNADLVIHIKR
jgi:hypothetical protein